MEKLNENKINLPTAIVLGCLILGGAFYAVQVNKQNSIEKQQQMEQKQKQEQIDNLNKCFNDAQTKKSDSINYWEAFKEKTCDRLSGSLEGQCLDGVLKGDNEAIAKETQDRAECLKIYPQN